MPASIKVIECEWCNTPFAPTNKTGPTPKYCKRSCRQRAYEHRNNNRDKLLLEIQAWIRHMPYQAPEVMASNMEYYNERIDEVLGE